MESPRIQNAGQIPCLFAIAFVPNLISASARVITPAAGVKVYTLSTRPEVHPPETELSTQGTSWIVLPPLNWTLAFELEYVSSSPLTPKLPVMMFQLLELGDAPAAPSKLSVHSREYPEYEGGAHAEAREAKAGKKKA
jgi:hypothetical protein